MNMGGWCTSAYNITELCSVLRRKSKPSRFQSACAVVQITGSPIMPANAPTSTCISSPRSLETWNSTVSELGTWSLWLCRTAWKETRHFSKASFTFFPTLFTIHGLMFDFIWICSKTRSLALFFHSSTSGLISVLASFTTFSAWLIALLDISSVLHYCYKRFHNY